ncbi:hypothetical protein GCM10008955_40650 [Deinococcus malanensis]|uniref:Uncharacterized protein n=1 Tax=Deinococcus malanensis TaxID=1706855 RepID=A0ABQ2F206_9DEIO|nr:hypothetical protein [Deinococcus malanensis]GGK42743.1 hypothetical protein GCM10008955_40650 [Deinococcus malanensis]
MTMLDHSGVLQTQHRLQDTLGQRIPLCEDGGGGYVLIDGSQVTIEDAEYGTIRTYSDLAAFFDDLNQGLTQGRYELIESVLGEFPAFEWVVHSDRT